MQTLMMTKMPRLASACMLDSSSEYEDDHNCKDNWEANEDWQCGQQHGTESYTDSDSTDQQSSDTSDHGFNSK